MECFVSVAIFLWQKLRKGVTRQVAVHNGPRPNVLSILIVVPNNYSTIAPLQCLFP